MPSSLSRAVLTGVCATTALGGLASTADAKLIRGTVVHRDPAAHSFVVAGRSGRLFAVHSRRQPRLGRRVVIKARRLPDGAYRLRHLRVTGHVNRTVRVRGVVSSVNRQSDAFTVSSPGASVLVVSIKRSAVRMVAADASVSPSVGARVVVRGVVDSRGDLRGQHVRKLMATPPATSTGTLLSVFNPK